MESTDAKLLYGILLDRMQLSIKNGWMDREDGKVFIYYPIEKIMDALTCGNKKAGHLLAELDDRRGIGLITRVHQGLGKPDKIYVHKCMLPGMQKPKCRGDPSGAEKTGPDVLDGQVQRCHLDMSGDVLPVRTCQKHQVIRLMRTILISMILSILPSLPGMKRSEMRSRANMNLIGLTSRNSAI